MCATARVSPSTSCGASAHALAEAGGGATHDVGALERAADAHDGGAERGEPAHVLLAGGRLEHGLLVAPQQRRAVLRGAGVSVSACTGAEEGGGRTGMGSRCTSLRARARLARRQRAAASASARREETQARLCDHAMSRGRRQLTKGEGARKVSGLREQAECWRWRRVRAPAGYFEGHDGQRHPRIPSVADDADAVTPAIASQPPLRLMPIPGDHARDAIGRGTVGDAPGTPSRIHLQCPSARCISISICRCCTMPRACVIVAEADVEGKSGRTGMRDACAVARNTPS